jgi:hypothetical protein
MARHMVDPVHAVEGEPDASHSAIREVNVDIGSGLPCGRRLVPLDTANAVPALVMGRHYVLGRRHAPPPAPNDSRTPAPTAAVYHVRMRCAPGAGPGPSTPPSLSIVGCVTETGSFDSAPHGAAATVPTATHTDAKERP